MKDAIGFGFLALLPAYQLFLTRRFAIEKNATLEKYVIGNDVFDTLDASCKEADNRYERLLSALREEEEQAHREADELEKNRALSKLQLAEQKAQCEELEAKLASSREANLKKSLIAGTVIFTICLVVLVLLYSAYMVSINMWRNDV